MDREPDISALWAEAERFPDKIYPVDKWTPALCGEMDVLIRKDGTWLHEGRPIERPEIVRLFAKLLRYEDGAYFLVTPVEKLRITVEDLPFRIVDRDGLTFISDQGARLPLGEAHPLMIDVHGDEWLPRLRVRGDLWARMTRAETYRLFDAAQIEMGESCVWLTLEGQRVDVPLCEARKEK